MTISSDICVNQAFSAVAEFLGTSKPTANTFCAGVRTLSQNGLSVLCCQHWLGRALPTGLCLLLRSGGTLTSSGAHFRDVVRNIEGYAERFACIVVSSAPVLYGVNETWRHAFATLHHGDSVEVIDPLEIAEDVVESVLKNSSVAHYAGRFDSLCGVFWQGPWPR